MYVYNTVAVYISYTLCVWWYWHVTTNKASCTVDKHAQCITYCLTTSNASPCCEDFTGQLNTARTHDSGDKELCAGIWHSPLWYLRWNSFNRYLQIHFSTLQYCSCTHTHTHTYTHTHIYVWCSVLQRIYT